MDWLLSHFEAIVVAIVAIYEALVRAFPTIKNYSLIALVLRILTAISDALNRKK